MLVTYFSFYSLMENKQAELKKLVQEAEHSSDARLLLKKHLAGHVRRVVEDLMRKYDVASNYEPELLLIGETAVDVGFNAFIKSGSYETSPDTNFEAYLTWWVRQAVVARLHETGRGGSQDI